MTDFFEHLERELAAATPHRAQRRRRARLRRAAAVSTVLVALVSGGAGLASALSGSDAGTSASGGPAAPAPAPVRTATEQTTPVRGTYTVSILNGTTTPGLARAVAIRLQNAKFKIGNVTNAAGQDRAQTQVFYARPDALAAAGDVAHVIDVAPGALARVTTAERAIAGDQADVIVLVGSDQNTSPHG
jgi:hypothetical protein